MAWHKTKNVQIILSLALLMVVILPVQAQDLEDPEQPIRNLQFQSADIRSVLTFLADYGQVNVVIAPDVEGVVTIKLQDVHWRKAMEIIGRTYDLAVVDEEDDYIRIERAEDYRKEVMEQEQHRQQTQQLAELKTVIVQISNSTSDDIVSAVKSLMTERGQATSDSRSNSIIIQEVPSNIDRVLQYVKELDKPAKQIRISTQLLEIFSDDLEEIGINWSVAGDYVTESGRVYSQEGEVLADENTDVIGRYRITALQKGWTAQAVVEALVRSGKGKIIAHPEITTVDNKPAKIQMGQKIPIKQFDASGNVTIVFEEVGTILRVTPHITAEDQILMHLAPERSTYTFDPNGVIINTNNAETNVIVNNGHTAVIGGLTTEDEIDTEVGVPILKDIPLMGRLFKYTNKRTEVRDLVIFVTPTIVDDKMASSG